MTKATDYAKLRDGEWYALCERHYAEQKAAGKVRETSLFTPKTETCQICTGMPEPIGRWTGNYGVFNTVFEAQDAIQKEIRQHLCDHNYDAPVIAPDGSLYRIEVTVALKPWPDDEL